MTAYFQLKFVHLISVTKTKKSFTKTQLTKISESDFQAPQKKISESDFQAPGQS